MGASADTTRRRSLSGGILIWLACLGGYCVLQTLANLAAVELHDLLILGLPLFAAAASGLALRAAPQVFVFARILIGGVAAFVFGHVYFQYFRWIIVNTMHIWARDEGLLWTFASIVGLLIWLGVPAGMIAGGWLGGSRKARLQASGST